MANKFHIDKVIANVQRTKRELPIILAKQAQSEFVKNFTNEGFDGSKWITPNRRIAGTDEYKYPKTKGLSRRTKPTLTMSGVLRRATANSIREARWDKIMLVIDLPYAARHNDGLDGMPERKYVGQTKSLTLLQIQTINNYFNQVWH